MAQEWLTAKQIADELLVNVMTIYRRIDAGEIEAVKVGRSYRISRKEFDRYLREAKTGGPRRSAGSAKAP